MRDPNPVTRLNAALEGRYRIEREVGEGGMATVYLADDLKHERKVALKVLKPELAAVVGAERFVAEIKTTANLQHPHILPLHDSGDADGFLFYVMPYVEGETLGQRLDREHQLPVDVSVQIATNVAEALDYAHRRGVVHRDIKPANVLLQDGKPVIADFGIALAVGAAGGGRLTETGLSLGTPYYMSPEQATGDQHVGPATDIYALGCVLYEMLVGDPPFIGSTAQAVLGQIITGEPVSAVEKRRSIPANVDASIRRALEKLPADRFTTAGEFAASLASPGFRHGRADQLGERPRARPRSSALLLAAASAAAGVAGGLLLARGGSTPVASAALQARFEVSVADGLTMPFAQEPPIAVSPDGTLLAYLTPGGIAVRPIDSFEARVLPNTRNVMTLMFSPDGSRIAFIQQPYLRSVPVEGGPATTIAEIGAPGGVGSTWSARGGFLLTGVGSNGIHWVPEDGGQPTQFTDVLAAEGENIHAWPEALPGTDAILFSALGPGGGWEDGKTVLFDPGTGARLLLIEGGTHAKYSPTGHILYLDQSGTVFARPFDLAAREWTGSAVAVVSGVRLGSWGGGGGYDVSESGVIIWIGGSELDTHRLVTLDRTGAEVGDLGSSPATGLKLSTDGRTLLVDNPTGNNIDMWLLDLATGEQDRFTFDINEEETAVWSPGDDRIIWGAAQPGGGRFAYVQPADRSSERQIAFEHPYHLHVTDWSRDERFVAFYDFHPTEGSNVYLADLQDSGRVMPIATTNANEAEATFSPDGQWLAYTSDETGEWEVFWVSVPDGSQKRQLTDGGGFQPRWDREQREIFYLTKGWTSTESPTLMVRPIRPGATPDFGPETPLFSLPYPVAFEPSPDGQSFHTLIARPESRAYTIRILLNWMEVME